MGKITFEQKEDRYTLPGDRKYKVVAADINEIKQSVNEIWDLLAYLRQRIRVNITSSDFSGNYYANSNLVNLTPDVDFVVNTNGGSGVALRVNDGYTFNATLGRIYMDAADYSITIYKAVV